jgi:hypothetical protein
MRKLQVRVLPPQYAAVVTFGSRKLSIAVGTYPLRTNDHMSLSVRQSSTAVALVVFACAALAACSELISTEPSIDHARAGSQRVMFQCTASRASLNVSCDSPSIPEGVRADIIGGQNVMVKLTSSNVSYDAGTQIFQFDLTVQNLLNETVGTPGGGIPDPEGIRVFFHTPPSVTSGTGSISVANADGIDAFTAAGQPYYRYPEILDKDEVSAAKAWQLSMPLTVNSFTFSLLLDMDWEPKLVINEVMANPNGTIEESTSEWLELYNAGSKPVDLENLVIADSAASGRRPYHVISSSVVVQPGGYVVLGNSTNTVSNQGVPVDYAYGSALQLANSLDAVKIARVVGMDTVTIDRIQYSNSAVSAKSGISRELTNPALDNSNMDGSNWADAAVTAVYGAGGRGTPTAQNSTLTPLAVGNRVVNARSSPPRR